MKRLSILSLLMALTACGEADPVIRAGPMAGGGSEDSMTIWLQTAGPSRARIIYWPAAADDAPATTPVQSLRRETQFAGHFELSGLAPDTEYEYQVLLNGKPTAQGQTFSFATPAVWRPGRTPEDFVALLGSCAWINHNAYYNQDNAKFAYHRIFTTMAKRDANMMLWLGDNIYFSHAKFDTTVPSGMARRYWHNRGLPRLQPLLQSGVHYAIWDDHDYGPNNGDHRFIYKYTSLKLFRRYWANSSYGLPGTSGVFNQFSFNDVDFFLLDNRFYRDPERAPGSPDKAMFGTAQMEWLKARLMASTANFKIIAAGSGMLRDTPEGGEGWSHYPDERDDFLEWLKDKRISGVVFLSGDAHFTEMSRIQRPGHYPLYDLTCSPLTSRPLEEVKDYPAPSTRVPGTLVGQRNFCQMQFIGDQDDRRLVLSTHDMDGQRLWRREIPLQELQ